MQYERKIKKVMDKGCWFKNLSDENDMKTSWRVDLTDHWKGARPIQTKVKGYEYLSTLTVPNTAGSGLLRALARIEPGLTRGTGFAIKLIEGGGTPLFLSFISDSQEKLCPRSDCMVCAEHDMKGSSKCRVKSIVYIAKCLDCEKSLQQHIPETNVEENDILDDLFARTFNIFTGQATDEILYSVPKATEQQIYVGETSRTLYERSLEHLSGALRLEPSNFMVKHWVKYHFDDDAPPRFKFSVYKKRPDALV